MQYGEFHNTPSVFISIHECFLFGSRLAESINNLNFVLNCNKNVRSDCYTDVKKAYGGFSYDYT